MSERLNPKLIRRSRVEKVDNSTAEQINNQSFLSAKYPTETASTIPQSEQHCYNDIDIGATETTNATSNILPSSKNPKRHLLHDGQWIPKEFLVGRPVPRTGIWSCCGFHVHYSLYCESLEHRANFQEMMEEEIRTEKDETKKTELNKRFLRSYISSQVPIDAPELIPKLTDEQIAMQAAHSTTAGFNVPMLVSWLNKHMKEEPTMLEGLAYVHHHLLAGDGCVLLHRHNLLDVVFKICKAYPQHFQMQLWIVRVLQQLLDCNFTRDAVLTKHGSDLLLIAHTTAHRFMHSAAHVEAASRCILQCSRVSTCAQIIFQQQILRYMLLYCKQYIRHVSILRSTISLCYWLASEHHSALTLYKYKILQFAVRCMRQHQRERSILAPAISLLARLAEVLPEAMETLLKLQVASLVVRAMQVVLNDSEVTLIALKLLQSISRTSEGFEQLNQINNAWQTIAQGTLLGDGLVHRLPGAFQNPGWALGDTPYLPELDRQKLAARDQIANNSLQAAPKKDWTSFSLRQYMGLPMGGKKLAINTEYHELYYELIVILDLLPVANEEKEAWFRRLHEFEQENNLQIQEMVLTVQEIRRRDAQNKQMQQDYLCQKAKGGEATGFGDFQGIAKPLFVNGVQITSQSLEEADRDVQEALQF